MDLEIIKTVLTVARLKSFTAAAFAIPCAQSSVSRRVKSAEDELNVRIFTRPMADASKSVELTQAGERVVKSMAKILDDYSEMYQIAESEKNGAMLLNLGIKNRFITPMGISHLKGDFYEQQPNFRISIRTGELKTLIAELQMRYIDAALLLCASIDIEKCNFDSNLSLSYLGKTGFSVGISNMNPLAKKERLRISELKNETFLICGETEHDTPGIELLDREKLCSLFDNNYIPEIRMIPSNMFEIRYKLSVENKGVFPSFTPKPWRMLSGISFLSVSDVEFPSYYYLLHLKGRKEKEIAAFAGFFSERLSNT